ncbi:MAG: heavy-metal-associated domain-containing protein [Planctomycetes bacterium]|nr:heavy-metal-associated domain-containing protein [Planctomycetota bacterium]
MSGLPGVGRIEVNLAKNLLHIRYDPNKVTPETMLVTVGKEGFEGRVVDPDR